MGDRRLPLAAEPVGRGAVGEQGEELAVTLEHVAGDDVVQQELQQVAGPRALGDDGALELACPVEDLPVGGTVLGDAIESGAGEDPVLVVEVAFELREQLVEQMARERAAQAERRPQSWED